MVRTLRTLKALLRIGEWVYVDNVGVIDTDNNIHLTTSFSRNYLPPILDEYRTRFYEVRGMVNEKVLEMEEKGTEVDYEDSLVVTDFHFPEHIPVLVSTPEQKSHVDENKLADPSKPGSPFDGGPYEAEHFPRRRG